MESGGTSLFKDRHFISALGIFRAPGRGGKGSGGVPDADGFAERALFGIDPKVKIVWSYCSPLQSSRGRWPFSSVREIFSSRRKNNEHVERVQSRGMTTYKARTALVTLVEYGDYECPHCGAPIPSSKSRTPRPATRFVFRNFPLPQLLPLPTPAAETA